ncbi:hypothetical protein JHW33_07545 [Rahnella aceris]|uniref:hypothetical protein n=1 Tax=Rahnella sp. (strain Y9602) TaxID=2703885 RepID=UPI001908BB3B|nr:hypothetical protein [Rahnella aceris]QQN36465.1 hypothetical protein JHW33_07545 [Rahnella aceris]
MKLNKSKMALCLLVASAATSSIMAHADDFSAPDTHSVDLTFEAPVAPVSMTFTLEPKMPTSDEVTPAGTVLFTATTNSNFGSVRLAQGYTQGLPNQVGLSNTNDTKSSYATLLGQSDPINNQMKIYMSKIASSEWIKNGAQSMIVQKGSGTTQPVTYSINGAQTLKADTYTASIDGAAYYP